MIEWSDTPKSSNIRSVGYDPETNEMTVAFRSGGTYAYSGVDSVTASDLAGAASPGEYFSRHVRNKYPVQKL